MKLDAFLLLNRNQATIVSGERVKSRSADIDIFEDSSSAADLIDGLFSELGASQRSRIGLGLPSEFFFPVSIDHAVGSEGRLDELKFSLEQELPLDAEAMSVIVLPNNQQVVVANTPMIAPLLRCLESNHQIRFGLVSSTNLLIAVARLGLFAPRNCNAVIVGSRATEYLQESENWLDWIYQVGLPESQAELDFVNSANELIVENGVNFECAGTAERLGYEELMGDVFGAGAAPKVAEQLNFAEQFYEHAGLGRQAHSIWDYAGLAAAVGLILLAIAFAFRASSLRHQAATLNAKTRAEFRRLFPEERLNAPVESLLAAKLELAERVGELSEFGQTNRNQVALLARVLRGLKGVPDLKVSRMVLQGNTVELTGSVSNLEQFEQLKISLKDSGLESGIDSDYSADFTLRLTAADVDSLP